MGHQLAIVTALPKQRVRMGLLEIAAANFRTRNLRRKRQHRHARAVTVEKAVDQMQIARATASGADGKISGQMRLRAGGESSRLFVTAMNPVDVAALAQRFRDPVETIANDAIDPANADRVEHFCDNVGNFHGPASLTLALIDRASCSATATALFLTAHAAGCPRVRNLRRLRSVSIGERYIIATGSVAKAYRVAARSTRLALRERRETAVRAPVAKSQTICFRPLSRRCHRGGAVEHSERQRKTPGR